MRKRELGLCHLLSQAKDFKAVAHVKSTVICHFYNTAILVLYSIDIKTKLSISIGPGFYRGPSSELRRLGLVLLLSEELLCLKGSHAAGP
jgi:hypothetical protein